MAEITITIPDDLAQQLAPYEHQLSNLFTQLVATPPLSRAVPSTETMAANPTAAHNTHQEILKFLISRPTPEQIISFKVSNTSQQLLQVLLQKSRDAALTDIETAELDLYEQLNTLMGLLKVRAYAAFNRSKY